MRPLYEIIPIYGKQSELAKCKLNPSASLHQKRGYDLKVRRWVTTIPITSNLTKGEDKKGVSEEESRD